MSLSVNITVSGGADFIQKLKALGPKLTNFSKPLKEIGTELKKYYSGQVFESQGGVYGTPWAQLSPSTQKYKAIHYVQYSAVPLIATDTMRNSFRATVSPRRLVIDNTAPYFPYHQSSDARTKLPRRQMIGISDDVKQIIKQIITKDINSKLHGL